jgi:hypothetical protein
MARNRTTGTFGVATRRSQLSLRRLQTSSRKPFSGAHLARHDAMTCLKYQTEWIKAHKELGTQFVTLPLCDAERLVATAVELERRALYAETELRRREREAGWTA